MSGDELAHLVGIRNRRSGAPDLHRTKKQPCRLTFRQPPHRPAPVLALQPACSTEEPAHHRPVVVDGAPVLVGQQRAAAAPVAGHQPDPGDATCPGRLVKRDVQRRPARVMTPAAAVEHRGHLRIELPKRSFALVAAHPAHGSLDGVRVPIARYSVARPTPRLSATSLYVFVVRPCSSRCSSSARA